MFAFSVTHGTSVTILDGPRYGLGENEDVRKRKEPEHIADQSNTQERVVQMTGHRFEPPWGSEDKASNLENGRMCAVCVLGEA